MEQNQYQNSIKRQRQIGVILSYITLGLSTIISLVYTPYMLDCLGQSEYGLYQLIGSLAQYLSLLSLGLSGAYIRFYAKYKEEEGYNGIRRLNGAYLIAFTIIAFGALSIGLGITINLPVFFAGSMTHQELKTGQVMMVLMSINMALTLIETIFASFISANEKFIFQRIVKLVYAIVHPVVCVVALSFGGKAVALVYIALASTVLMLLSEIIFCIRALSFAVSIKGITKTYFTEIFGFSFFILLNDLVNQINWNVDKVILGYFSGTIAVSIYGIAAQLNTYYLSISTTISSVYAPQVNRIVAGSESEDKKRRMLDDVFCNVGRIQFFIVLLVISGYVFFGRQFISVWAGIEYDDAYFIGLWLMLPVSIPLLQNIGIEIQRAQNKHKIRSIVYLVIAISNIIISIPLCKVMGAIGCAVGTAISLVVGNILFMNWYYFKKMGIDIPRFWRMIGVNLRILIVPTIVGILINRLIEIDSYYMLAIFILLYVLVYCVSVYLLGLNTEEKHEVRRVIANRITKR